MGTACTCGGELTRKLEELLQRHRGQPGALIQVLHQAQNIYGYLPKEVLKKVSLTLNVPLSRVYGVVSFYSFFTTKPKGKHQISVCKGTACYVRGAGQLLNQLQEEMGLKPGDTTDDGEFSLEVVRCLGACGLGPVITVDQDVHARLVPARLKEVLDNYRQASSNK
ncbi:NADH-quinone oxidoreductase subunit NuoE [Desulfofundulus thermobenzoicus]|uniref:NADH-quinone oxidoreductase subunit NuoE n=1 Tax=Desulfofundulus thermobenzoicus TaxID=29376 RepID=A0A6N7IMV6_9FIRM|nr:NADH-quinone oxidoreductase subunit NuoE [Desulfofundulus thermobenzoicus]MQL50983.1 NADH-quinone oxidoreductase subunit NuoE [Desulfofundulus thermobenzoicus]HHW43480.1 NADH-quinone oxidoreductase subunit NuoE [Desulfotomaculum sp.]